MEQQSLPSLLARMVSFVRRTFASLKLFLAKLPSEGNKLLLWAQEHKRDLVVVVGILALAGVVSAVLVVSLRADWGSGSRAKRIRAAPEQSTGISDEQESALLETFNTTMSVVPVAPGVPVIAVEVNGTVLVADNPDFNLSLSGEVNGERRELAVVTTAAYLAERCESHPNCSAVAVDRGKWLLKSAAGMGGGDITMSWVHTQLCGGRCWLADDTEEGGEVDPTPKLIDNNGVCYFDRGDSAVVLLPGQCRGDVCCPPRTTTPPPPSPTPTTPSPPRTTTPPRPATPPRPDPPSPPPPTTAPPADDDGNLLTPDNPGWCSFKYRGSETVLQRGQCWLGYCCREDLIVVTGEYEEWAYRMTIAECSDTVTFETPECPRDNMCCDVEYIGGGFEERLDKDTLCSGPGNFKGRCAADPLGGPSVCCYW
ncbi:unnamed protein product [Vitrella brassicaformis CCMP3155]|uniref:Uncharacterized protein n=2 Tax=Vitrella brassicaformis TaxID=1169539 RepID=A0A0G4FV73_VITBC|nr:unnamed protein product [Vitrella brassicaformis CCMP3155]|eukprot:CEM18811.1 unnamed protein product [Vitrella brassicaformis CCMP3155]